MTAVDLTDAGMLRFTVALSLAVLVLYRRHVPLGQADVLPARPRSRG